MTENRQLITDNQIQHVAIIMDGNRRWAKNHHLAFIKGHRKAAYETIDPLVDVCIENRIPYLTLWAFSTENWQRDTNEVEGLLMLFRQTLSENIDKLHKKGVRVTTIGDLSKFPKDIQNKVEEGRLKTKNNKKITLCIALNYGGRDEIIRATNCLIKKRIQNKNNSWIYEKELEELLDTAGTPDPDLIIRTGGEIRLSGFLTWQSVYSEWYFTDTLFPDFTPIEFKKALDEYFHRKRRFGR